MKSFQFESKIDENLSLVIPDLSCASEIFDLIDKDRGHLRTWLPWVDNTHTVDDTRANLVERIKSFKKKEQAPFYGTFKGEFIASVGFVVITDGKGEIGYWLLSEYSGRGFMTTYVKACINYGFNELGLDRVIIKCAEGNNKSAAIPIRLGFTLSERKEVERVRNGKSRPVKIFTLDKGDWTQ